jgi:hypothetical protein
MTSHDATAVEFIDWTEREIQREWFPVRHLLEHEVHSATEPTRTDFGIAVALDSATITTYDGTDYLRVPVNARWQGRMEQAIAYILVSRPVEDDPRAVTIGEDVARALERWVQRDVPPEMTPTLYYPELRSDWPAEVPAAPPPTPTPAQAAPAAAAPRASAPAKPAKADSTGTEQNAPMPPAGKAIPTPTPPAPAAPAGVADATENKTAVPRVRAENPAAMGSTEAPATPAEAAAGEAAMSEIVEGGEGKAGGETPSEEALPKPDGEA